VTLKKLVERRTDVCLKAVRGGEKKMKNDCNLCGGWGLPEPDLQANLEEGIRKRGKTEVNLSEWVQSFHVPL